MYIVAASSFLALALGENLLSVQRQVFFRRANSFSLFTIEYG